MTSRQDQAPGRQQPAGQQALAGPDAGGMLVHSGMRRPDTPCSPLSAADVAAVVAMAGRAPSVHNTQPWRFAIHDSAIDLLADTSRLLPSIDPDGRELMISCGAALFGLRLGLRSRGRLPVAHLQPDPARPWLLARVLAEGHAGVAPAETELIAAVPHRHTHRGAFSPSEVPARLLDVLVAEAAVEGAELILVTSPAEIAALAGLARAAAAEQQASAEIRAELSQWVRPAGSQARDGVPARARLSGGQQAGPADQWLPRRLFGQPGTEVTGDEPPGAVAVLVTSGDLTADWLRAGQALNRLLLRAASRWVFASLQSQPLELPRYRQEVRSLVRRHADPQMLLQFGRANTAPATPRRPVAALVTKDPDG
ncbi:MAG: hypothetical protein WAL16_08900 [Streptosporangiaceae bacterium]